MVVSIQPEALPGIRLAGPLTSITVATTTTGLYIISAGKRVIIRKISWFNHQALNVLLQIGYDTLGAVWTSVMNDIMMLANMDGQLEEGQLPICGNTPEGFVVDTTPVTGFAGVIAAQADASAVAPDDIEVKIEIEEF